MAVITPDLLDFRAPAPAEIAPPGVSFAAIYAEHDAPAPPPQAILHHVARGAREGVY